MIVGIVRHNKVDYNFPFFTNSENFNKIFQEYSDASIVNNNIKQVENWDICFSSPLKRTCDSAKYHFKGEVVCHDELKEIPIKAPFKFKFKLPIHLWFLISRIAWYFNRKSQPETKRKCLYRAEKFLAECFFNNENKKVLIVTHGSFMFCLKKILKKNGFKGEHISFIKPPIPGKIYFYKKQRKS